jgi:release factor glutamine methyltransferase
MKILKALEQAESVFKKERLATPRLDAEVLLSHTTGKDRTFLYKNFDRVLSDEEQKLFLSYVERRLNREPVAYLTGKKEFWSLELEVNRKVLIPRPDTEVVVEETLRIAKELGKRNIRILDVGTGSGAICIALASEIADSSIVTTDTSVDALRIAKKNAESYGLEKRILLTCANLFEPLSGKFDIVVSNPPYISEGEFESLPEEIKRFEPKEALVSGSDGTEYHREIIMRAAGVLKKGGFLVMEIGSGQKTAIERMIRDKKEYSDIVFRRDYGGIERVVSARTGG